ncbi:MAG: lipid-A-disaccharide synthase [Deltaproteobacteria bacterium]
MEKTKLVLIVAGEASSDLHASSLVREMKNIYPGTAFFGLGGKKLKQEGVDLYFDIVEMAVVGFFEVLRNLKKFKDIFDGLLKEVDKRKPDLAILVDYPGFNLRLAGELKKRGVPVLYYISPQVWAWGKNRIKTIKMVVDLMVVVFKFEEELYKSNGVPVAFVGHPLLDTVKPGLSREDFFAKSGLSAKKFTFALLPGSREKEIRLLLPVMLDTAKLLYRQMPDSQFLILRSPTVGQPVFDRIVSGYDLPVTVISDMTYAGLNASDFALVASGTATLETAIMGIPMVILYKISFLTWAYLKMAIRVPYIGLVNLVKREKFIAEFIQYEARPGKISGEILATLHRKERLDFIKTGLRDVARRLGEKGASKKAAQLAINLLDAK